MNIATCEICKKEFTRKWKFTGKYSYCSIECRIKGQTIHPNRPSKGKNKTCPICGIEFYVMPGQLETRVNCSYKCANKAIENRSYLKCRVCGKDYSRPVSQVKWRGSNYCSYECQSIGYSVTKAGENSSNWKGGVSYLGRRFKKGLDWKTWKRSVYKRDDYTCQICGKNKDLDSILLHPHHIKSYSLYPELRFDVNNGQTLCSACHYELHAKLKRDAKSRKELSPAL